MKKFILILALFHFANFKLFCQVGISSYSSLSLSENIKKDADAVYRLDEGILEITSSSKYTFATHQIITLLNKDAAHHLHQTIAYNKFHKIENAIFKIYNGTGELIKTYQKKDFTSR